MNEMVTRRTMVGGLTFLPILSNAVLAADSIKVGVIIPLSGGAGRQGQDVTNSIQAMASLINADGGVLGRPVEMLVRDDESTPAIGVAKAIRAPQIGETWIVPAMIVRAIAARVPLRFVAADSFWYQGQWRACLFFTECPKATPLRSSPSQRPSPG